MATFIRLTVSIDGVPLPEFINMDNVLCFRAQLNGVGEPTSGSTLYCTSDYKLYVKESPDEIERLLSLSKE